MNNEPFIALGPMAGITDYPFRKMVLKFGASAVTTEMVSSEALTRNSKKTFRRINIFNDNCKKIVQIVGCDVQRMIDAAKINQDLGADVLDINMGCPAKKIINSFAGSALMKDENLACKIVENVVNSVNIPVTVKMRLGWDFTSINVHTLAQKFQNLGVVQLAIHGRTRSQFYSGVANWKAIAQTAENSVIPVVCNGDIKNFHDAKISLLESKCSGLMIARSAIGAPWLLRQIIEQLKNDNYLKNDKSCIVKNDMPATFEMPTLLQQKEIVKEHLLTTLEYYGKENGICIFRKHLCAYSKGLNGANEFRVKINTIIDLHQLFTEIEKFYDLNCEKMQ